NDGFGWLEPGPLPTTVNGGEAVALPVTFSPANTTTKTGTITVESDDCEVPTQTIDVIAAGKIAKEPPPCLPAGEFAPKVAWEWKANDAQKKYSFVFMSPIVINLDDDDGDGDIGGGDIPEVVFVAHDGSFGLNFNDDRPGVLRAIHGKDGSPMWASNDPNHQPGWASNLAAAEIDGQPGPEIVVFGYQPSKPGKNCPGVPDVFPAPFCGKYIEGHLLAFHGSDGSLYWKSQPFTGAVSDMENMGAPTLTDLEGDGIVDVVAGNTVYNGIDGSIKWVGSAGRGNDAHGYLTVVADLDGNGEREVIAGNTAYHADGSIMWTTAMTDTHGTGVADLDGNGSMEVFINGTNGQSIIVDGKTGAILKGPKYTGIIGCCVAAPAIADVDSSKPGLEIITVGDSMLKVLDKDLNLLWSKEISDETGAAGPAAFDVEGDGVAEVIYADEGTLWILRGSDGKVIFEAPRSSATGQDNPVIADVDGDNHAEILVPMESGFGGPGLRLYSNQDDSWVATRRLWNQHSFGVADIFDNATLPQKGTAAGFSMQILRTNYPTCK
ncbi:MAG TPA: hypothetical protein EYN66_22015, partial [Myxococcales bacterium]|nr:hypothetical protein [Myxococcales bacterium]